MTQLANGRLTPELIERLRGGIIEIRVPARGFFQRGMITVVQSLGDTIQNVSLTNPYQGKLAKSGEVAWGLPQTGSMDFTPEEEDGLFVESSTGIVTIIRDAAPKERILTRVVKLIPRDQVAKFSWPLGNVGGEP